MKFTEKKLCHYFMLKANGLTLFKLFYFVCNLGANILSKRIFKTASEGPKTAIFRCNISPWHSFAGLLFRGMEKTRYPACRKTAAHARAHVTPFGHEITSLSSTPLRVTDWDYTVHLSSEAEVPLGGFRGGMTAYALMSRHNLTPTSSTSTPLLKTVEGASPLRRAQSCPIILYSLFFNPHFLKMKYTASTRNTKPII
jgi:hypothetical protein